MKSTVVGLTGGISTGKSTVTRILRVLGIPVVDADEVAREVVTPGSEGLRRIVSYFGHGILSTDGTLDRAKLGAQVFLDAGAREKLGELLDSLIRQESNRLLSLQRETHPLVVFDAALLIEKGLAEQFRPLVVVTARADIQLARLQARDGFTEAEARARIESQMPLEQKTKMADYVLDNSGTEVDLVLQVKDLVQKLQAES